MSYYLEIKNVSKRYKQEEVLKRINLGVKRGEFFVILGPSGCGKTTLLKIIAGLLKPDNGTIILDQRDITHVEPGKRDVAMVFQNYALYPHLKVRDNILFPLKIRKVDKERQEESLRWVSSFLRIEELLDKKPSQLSGGQQQRVALARALVRKPKLFLMDEPLSNLDAKLRMEMRGELKELQRRLNITTIYVTHDQIEAMTLADRICIINKGRVQQIGTPQEIYEKPNNLFVASFIGTHGINVIELDNFFLCVRPEKFSISGNKDKDYEFFVKIKNSDFLGESYLLKGEVVEILYRGERIELESTELKIFVKQKPLSPNMVFYVKDKDIYKFKKEV